MCRIINIRKRGKNRQVILEDGRVFLLPPLVCVKYNLSPHKRLSQEMLDKICREADREKAFQYAFFLLSRRDYSQKAMEQKLRRRVNNSQIIDEVISFLLEKNYLNDERLLQSLFEYYLQERKSGRLYITLKLREKGFSQEDIEKCFHRWDTEYPRWEEENCRYWGAKWLGKKGCHSVEELDMRKRHGLYGYLMNKGFSSPVVAEYLQEK